MLRRVLGRLAARFSSEENTGDEDEDETRFVPSILDASVRYAHGGNKSGERELVKMQEQTRRLEQQQRKK